MSRLLRDLPLSERADLPRLRRGLRPVSAASRGIGPGPGSTPAQAVAGSSRSPAERPCTAPRLPLGQWLRAIWLIVASSKGISARKLGEMLGITYKVAWHLGHRIRSVMADRHLVLDGVVEMDEGLCRRPRRVSVMAVARPG